MRVTLRLAWKSLGRLPIHYHPAVQAAIYHTLEPSLAAFIHDQGIRYQARQFRLFTFSRLMGPYELSRDKQWIQFTGDSQLVVASPLNSLLQSLARRLLDKPVFRVGPSEANITEINAQKTPLVEEPVIRVKTLSPIVAYNTMHRADERKYTLYRAPDEPEFSRLLGENLQHKALALAGWSGDFGSAASSQPFTVSAVSSRRHLLKYRDIIVKGYSGMFIISGDPALLRLGIDSGFGSKNAQGFGCVARMPVTNAARKENRHVAGHAGVGKKLS